MARRANEDYFVTTSSTTSQTPPSFTTAPSSSTTAPLSSTTPSPSSTPTPPISTTAPPISCGAQDWNRVVYLNMFDTSQRCPSSRWNLISSPIRGCGCTSTAFGECDSVTYLVGQNYNKGCGRITAYQRGRAGAFHNVIGHDCIDEAYIDGIFLTHRAHTWYPPTWETTISVKQRTLGQVLTCRLTTSITPYKMDRGMAVVAAAVSSTCLRGFPRLCLKL